MLRYTYQIGGGDVDSIWFSCTYLVLDTAYICVVRRIYLYYLALLCIKSFFFLPLLSPFLQVSSILFLIKPDVGGGPKKKTALTVLFAWTASSRRKWWIFLSLSLLYHNYYIMRPVGIMLCIAAPLSLSHSALCINNNSDKKVKYFFRSIDTSSVDWRLWLTVYSHSSSSSHGIRCWANSLTDGDRPPYRAGAVAFFLFPFYFILKYFHI